MRISEVQEVPWDRKYRSVSPLSHRRENDTLFDWFNEHMRKMETDFFRKRSTLIPYYDSTHYPSYFFTPERRRRMYDSMFSLWDDMPRIVENHRGDAIEYEMRTGARGFDPEDVEVHVKGRNVEVKARKEKKSVDGNYYSLREVRQSVPMPDRVDVHRIAAEMEDDSGRLKIKAPLRSAYDYTWPAVEYRNRHALVPIRIARK